MSVVNYKNLVGATLGFSSKVNAFIGPNGAGKTNILDAIYLLSFCKGSRGGSDRQAITHGREFFIVAGDYVHDDGSEKISLYAGLQQGKLKTFRRDNVPYKRLSEHIGLVPLVMVSPTDIDLVMGQSDERRKLMDLAISQYDRSYVEALYRYNRALLQRNSALKEDESGVSTADMLSAYEEVMAEAGEVVFAARSQFIEAFLPVFRELYREISLDRERVELSYRSHCQSGQLLKLIQDGRPKDLIVGHSMHGVHRDDLEMTIGGEKMRLEGSHGQNKTFAIALKLAQFHFLKGAKGGTTPLLLLDDIFDKLDADRVERIVGIVSRAEYGQIFITDTNRSHLDQILSRGAISYKLFNVKEGNVSEASNGTC